MELYLDTADLAAVERLAASWPLAGVTTNPSLVAAGGRPLKSTLRELRACLGPEATLFAQVLGQTGDEMVDRITSYNVCYTKLLRPAFWRGFSWAGRLPALAYTHDCLPIGYSSDLLASRPRSPRQVKVPV